MKTPYRQIAPELDGNPADWEEVPALKLRASTQNHAELRSCYDGRMLYLRFCTPLFDAAEAKELGFSDELQIGISQPLSENEFGPDLLRLGFNAGATEPKDRTPGHKLQGAVGGAKCVDRVLGGQNCYEIGIPIRWLGNVKPRSGGRVLLDLSFLVPESQTEAEGAPEPAANTFSYRVKYGNDSLAPVHFVELNLQGNR